MEYNTGNNMERVTDRDASDLERPEWNSLEKNYDLHDIGEAFVRREADHLGLEAQEWGIDRRHDDDGLIYDKKMDLEITVPEAGAVKAIVEVKTKRNTDWYGTINRRHFRHYLDVTHERDVPVFIYMTLVDDGSDERGAVDAQSAEITRDTFIPIARWREFQRVLDGEYEYYRPEAADQFLVDQVDKHPQVEATWRAPDGNQVVDIDLDSGVGWPSFSKRVVDRDIPIVGE